MMAAPALPLSAASSGLSSQQEQQQQQQQQENAAGAGGAAAAAALAGLVPLDGGSGAVALPAKTPLVVDLLMRVKP
jgi:hypothetical protein